MLDTTHKCQPSIIEESLLTDPVSCMDRLPCSKHLLEGEALTADDLTHLLVGLVERRATYTEG